MSLSIEYSFYHSIFCKGNLMLNYKEHKLDLYLYQKSLEIIKCCQMQISKWIHFVFSLCFSCFQIEQLIYSCTKTYFAMAFKSIKYCWCLILSHLSNSNSQFLQKIIHLNLSCKMKSSLELYYHLMLTTQWTMVQFDNLRPTSFICKDLKCHHNSIQYHFNL